MSCTELPTPTTFQIGISNKRKKKELQHINRFANHRRARYQLSPKLNGRVTVNYGPVNRQKTNQNWPIAEPLDDNLTSGGGD